jgi:hypothetical protein
MARNILAVIHAVSNDESFTPLQNLKQIGRISKGFAPMLTEILEEYVEQNTGGPAYRIQRIKTAKQMLGVDARTSKAAIMDERKELTVLENAQVLIEVRTDQLRAAIRQVSDLTQALHEAQKAIDGSDIAAAKKVIDAALSAKAASGGI